MRGITAMLASITIAGVLGLIFLAAMIMLGGCASTLRVWGDRVSVTVHNRGDVPLDCWVQLRALDSASGEVRSRSVHIRVKPGVDNVRSIWASDGEHFIDAWRDVECWPKNPIGLDHIPRWP